LTLIILNIILCIILAALVFQDFKQRAIHVFLIVGVFVVGGFILWFNQNPLIIIFKTSLFVLVILSLLWVYLSIKNKKLINPFNKNIGLGDVLFFFAVTPLFSLNNYIIFFITGMFVTIIFSVIFKKFIISSLIPLAGILSGYLIILKITNLFIPQDIFYNAYINI